MSGIDTVLVAPVLNAPKAAAKGFIVNIQLTSGPRQVLLSQMAAVPDKSLGRVIESAAAYEDDLRRGIDRLFTGF